MYFKIIWIALIAITVLPADGKKTKKKNNNEVAMDSTPQPNVLTYSTFGFNDVGSYNGFVESSQDYDVHINNNNNNQESQMRLYAPAFPSSMDSTGLGIYYDPSRDNPLLNINSEGQNNIKSYQPVAINFFTSPSHDSINEKKNTGSKEIVEFNNDNTNYPTYGTKISSKLRNKPANDFNSTEYNIFDSVSSVIGKNYNNDYSSSLTSGDLQSSEDQNNFKIPSQSSSASFPKFLDFTSAKKFYPTSVESKYMNQKPIHLDMSQTSESNGNFYGDDNKKDNEHSYKNTYSGKDDNDIGEKQLPKGSFLNNQDHTDNYPNSNNNLKITKYRPEYKDKVKTKHEYFNNNDDTKTLRNPIKSFEYSTNHNTSTFQLDYGKTKQSFNSSIDEIVPDSSNFNFVNYRLPDNDFSSFKTLPNIKPLNTENDDIFSSHSHDTYKPSEEYLEAFKNYYSGVPSSASHWGNIFKTTEFSSFKKHPKKPYLDDEDKDEIVHIPKRPHNLSFENLETSDTSDWPVPNRYKFKKHKKQADWDSVFNNNKFKTEEDLLGLRNQDSLSASYSPPFKYNYNDLDKDFDYYKLSDRWRHNYLKSKNKDHEYGTYASEINPSNVLRPKPYSIEVPHPVIVPVPQPYPVKVPIPKLVTVPIIKELKVPIEKPMPYPVYKNVPYIVEKLVPVPVEKQVRVPIVKPYPVHVPQVRPVFHHKRPHDDQEEEDEYQARPDTRRPAFKRHKNSRNRPRPTTRRPTRMVYRDSSKRRYPVRRPVNSHMRPRRPSHAVDQTPPRYHEDFDDFEDSDSDYIRYCKRTGKC